MSRGFPDENRRAPLAEVPRLAAVSACTRITPANFKPMGMLNMNDAGFSPKRKLVASSAAITAAKARGLVKEEPEVIKQPPAPAAKKHALSYERVGEILTILRRFPAFRRPRPLRIGIFSELVTALNGEVEANELSIAMRIWTRNRVYLNRVRLGEERINLDGTLTGDFPSAPHKTGAAALLAARAATKKGGAR